MKEVKKKSVVPVYGVGGVIILYSVILPLFKTWHFVILAFAAVLAYMILSKLFPAKTVQVEIPEEPIRTGDEVLDALLDQGEQAVSEMSRLKETISAEGVSKKLDEIISVTDMIFKSLHENQNALKRVKRFAEYYLPMTLKLLHTYDRFGQSGAQGDNISGTMERIDEALDTILNSYKKFYDSLFENQALDIETDIRVLESMLRTEGLMN